MKALLIALVVSFLVIIAFPIYKKYADGLSYVTSKIDGGSYLVRNVNDSAKVADTLAKVRQIIVKLTNHLVNNIDKYDGYESYINRLATNVKRTVITEVPLNSSRTSYSVNKGEKLVFCVRPKKAAKTNKIYKLNLITYVALHEMSHIACPEYGHTDLFKRIFAFMTRTAVKIGLYKLENFALNPKEYCGMMIKHSII